MLLATQQIIAVPAGMGILVVVMVALAPLMMAMLAETVDQAGQG